MPRGSFALANLLVNTLQHIVAAVENDAINKEPQEKNFGLMRATLLMHRLASDSAFKGHCGLTLASKDLLECMRQLSAVPTSLRGTFRFSVLSAPLLCALYVF